MPGYPGYGGNPDGQIDPGAHMSHANPNHPNLVAHPGLSHNQHPPMGLGNALMPHNISAGGHQPPVMMKKLAIDPISREEIDRMNKEYLEPIINNSECLYIL